MRFGLAIVFCLARPCAGRSCLGRIRAGPRRRVRVRRRLRGDRRGRLRQRTHGTVVGATWATGRYGGALSFDGTNDYVGLPGLGTFYNTAFTLEAWVQKATDKNDVGIVGTWAGNGPMLWVDHLATRYHLTLGGSLSSLSRLGRESRRRPVAAPRRHLRRHDCPLLHQRRRGGVAERSPAAVGTSNTWRIGAYGSVPGGFFDGLIDEIRVYDRALSAAEVQADMSQPLGITEPRRAHRTREPHRHREHQTSISLGWTASTDDTGVSGYHVFADGAAAGTTTADVVHGHRPRPAPPAISSRWRLRRCRDTSPARLRERLDDVLRHLAGPRRGVRVRGGIRNRCERRVRQRQERDDQRRRRGRPAAHGGGALVRRHRRPRRARQPRHLLQQRLHARGLGAEEHGQEGRGDRRHLDRQRPDALGRPPRGPSLPTLGSSLSSYLDSGQSPLVGQWQHLAATFDGTTARYYVDGAQVASRAVSGSVGSSNTWRIGAYGASPGGFFDGVVDDVRVYNRALSAGEIQFDRDHGVTAVRHSARHDPAEPPGTLTATGGLGQASLCAGVRRPTTSAWSRYNVHRSTTSGFTPSAAQPDRATDGLSYTDLGLAGRHLLLQGHRRGRRRQRRPCLEPGQRGGAPPPTRRPPTCRSPPRPQARPSPGSHGLQRHRQRTTSRWPACSSASTASNVGAEDLTAPYSISWDTRGHLNGSHTLTAVARDTSGNISDVRARGRSRSPTRAPPRSACAPRTRSTKPRERSRSTRPATT